MGLFRTLSEIIYSVSSTMSAHNRYSINASNLLSLPSGVQLTNTWIKSNYTSSHWGVRRRWAWDHNILWDVRQKDHVRFEIKLLEQFWYGSLLNPVCLSYYCLRVSRYYRLKNANLLGKPVEKDFGGLLQTFPSTRWNMGGEQILFKVIPLKDSVGLKLRFLGI